jgi:polygalacturonase
VLDTQGARKEGKKRGERSMTFTRRTLVAITVLISSAMALGQAAVISRGPVFNVTDYGAHNDGSAPSTEAFAKAVAAAHTAGGGTVFVPAGRYISGPIEMVSNLTLDFDAGAIVTFPAQILPFTPGRQQGIETLTPVPLIGGHDLENVAVVGRGVLMSSNDDWMKLHGRTKATKNNPGSANGDHWENLLHALQAGSPVSEEERRTVAAELRPSFIRFMNSKNIIVSGLRFIGSPMWTVHLLYSENATVENLVIETYPGVHTDGIAVDSSRFVRIADDYIDTGDDGIVIKAGKDADGLRVNKPAEEITITNCTVHHAHGAVTIGSETSGSVRNVVASNITVVDADNGARIKSERGRGGVVENIRFENWTMRNVGEAIVVTSFYQMEGETPLGEQPVSKTTPIFRNIGMNHMTIDGAKHVIDIDGLTEMPLQTLRFEDIIGKGEVGMTAHYTDDLELHHVLIDAAKGPVYEFANATNLVLDDVSSRHPEAGAPVIRLNDSPGAIVRNSRAFTGTETFLSIDKGGENSIFLEGNVLGNAKNAIQ